MVVQLDLTFVDGVRNKQVGLVSASKERYAAPITERAMEDSRSWFQRALPPAETTKHYSAFRRIKDERSQPPSLMGSRLHSTRRVLLRTADGLSGKARPWFRGAGGEKTCVGTGLYFDDFVSEEPDSQLCAMASVLVPGSPASAECKAPLSPVVR